MKLWYCSNAKVSVSTVRNVSGMTERDIVKLCVFTSLLKTLIPIDQHFSPWNNNPFTFRIHSLHVSLNGCSTTSDTLRIGCSSAVGWRWSPNTLGSIYPWNKFATKWFEAKWELPYCTNVHLNRKAQSRSVNFGAALWEQISTTLGADGTAASYGLQEVSLTAFIAHY